MGLLGNLFGPKIDKLKERGDVEGLEAILASDAKLEHRVDAIDALADRNANSRLAAAELLAEIDAAPVEVQDRQAVLVTLLDLLGSKDAALGTAVTTAVERIPVSDVIDMQLERLEDPNSEEREETERLVRKLLEHGAIDPGERQAADRRLTRALAADPEDY